MKKLLITLSIALLSVCAFAQDSVGLRPMNWRPKPKDFKSQSLDVKTSSESVSLLYLRDGVSNNYTAIAYPMFQITGLNNKVSIVSLGAYDSNLTKTNIYVGTGLGINVVESGQFSLKAYAGWKGFAIGQNFSAAQGKEAWVVGFGLTAKIN